MHTAHQMIEAKINGQLVCIFCDIKDSIRILFIAKFLGSTHLNSLVSPKLSPTLGSGCE